MWCPCRADDRPETSPRTDPNQAWRPRTKQARVPRPRAMAGICPRSATTPAHWRSTALIFHQKEPNTPGKSARSPEPPRAPRSASGLPSSQRGQEPHRCGNHPLDATASAHPPAAHTESCSIACPGIVSRRRFDPIFTNQRIDPGKFSHVVCYYRHIFGHCRGRNKHIHIPDRRTLLLKLIPNFPICLRTAQIKVNNIEPR